MRHLIQTMILTAIAAICVNAQWRAQMVKTSASLRGLSVVDKNVVWASGTSGTVLRTINGGSTWTVQTVPGAEKLDFRDIEAFDAMTAYILSNGNGDSSRIYKTIDGGTSWKLQFRNDNNKAFFDAIACWDRNNCIAMSDPVDGKYVLIETTDGSHWTSIDTRGMPSTKEGEAAFAASGTCIITQGRRNAYIVSGGSDARVFRSGDRGSTWNVVETQFVKGTAGSGIFSIAMQNTKSGVLVGGDYEKPDQNNNNLAFTSDRAQSFRLGVGLSGYRSGVAYVDKKTLVAVGPNGSDISLNGGRTWRMIDKANYNAVGSKGLGSTWAVGAKGLVARLNVSR